MENLKTKTPFIGNVSPDPNGPKDGNYGQPNVERTPQGTRNEAVKQSLGALAQIKQNGRDIWAVFKNPVK